MDAEQFYRMVEERAGLASREDAVQAVEDTFFSLRQVLPGHILRALQEQLPPELATHLAGGAEEADPYVDKEVFVGPLMNTLDTEASRDGTLGGLDLVSVYAGDEAYRRVHGVFGVLKWMVDGPTLRALQDTLPDEIGEWLREA